MKECSFLNGRFIPALTAYEYRGYIIGAWARPEFTNGSTSVGIVYDAGSARIDHSGSTNQGQVIWK